MPGFRFVELEIEVNFLRPIAVATGLLRCEGRVVSQGSRVAEPGKDLQAYSRNHFKRVKP